MSETLKDLTPEEIELQKHTIESPNEIARFRVSAVQMQAWNVVRLLDSHAALSAELEAVARQANRLTADLARAREIADRLLGAIKLGIDEYAEVEDDAAEVSSWPQ